VTVFIIKFTNTGFEDLSAEFSRAGFKDFSMTLLKLRVPFFGRWFCQESYVRVREVFVEFTDDFPALSARTSQVEPALLLERAFVSVARSP
jgi:hypothetical protein